jgi:hypothetical protein
VGKKGALFPFHSIRTERIVLSHSLRSLALRPVGQRPPHTSIPVQDGRETSRDLKQMEEDEEEMERANAEVLQMQQRMMEGVLGYPFPFLLFHPTTFSFRRPR